MIPQLIALCGFQGSGKDSCADAITGQHGPYQRYALASPVKRICEIAFGLTWDEMEGDRELKEATLDRYPYDSPRHLMQVVGTDLFRNAGGWPTIWVEAMKRYVSGGMDRGEHFVISDLRFPNEAQAVHDLGGYVIRVNRTDRPVDLSAVHESEKYIPLLPVHHDIYAATGELEALCLQIRMICGLHQDLRKEDY